MSTFSSEQLNLFKFASVILDEFPPALRHVFVRLWDTKVAPTPSFKTWDDSLLVRNMFLSKEGGKTKNVPTNESYEKWDCTALFEATLYAQSFAVPVPGGRGKTLADLYVKAHRLPRGVFHASVTSNSGNNDETFALALDQLRLLRNRLCHNHSSKIDKKTFDQYIQLSKDALAALGQNFTRIDDIGKLAEVDFPTVRVQQLEQELRREKLRAIEDGIHQIDDQVKDFAPGLANVSSEVTDLKKEVKDFGSCLKDVGAEVLDTRTKAENVESDVKNVRTGVEDVKTTAEDVMTHVKDVKKKGLEGVKTSVEGVELNVNEVKTEVIGVNRNMEDVCSDLTEVKTGLADVETKLDQLKASVDDITPANACWKGYMVPASCVPDQIPNFYGRQEECEAILGHVAGSKTTRLVNIWGSPGFGKTSVAITIANRLREKNIAVYFVRLRGVKSKDDLVSKLLSIFTDVKQVPHISPSHWLAQCLQQLQNPFVLILDNADDLLESGDTTIKEEVLRLLKDILTQCCHIKLILTTRESLDYLKHEVPIHLERVRILDKISSAKLVKSLLPNVSENNSASILKECGQVPLAMRLMCGIMRGENVPLNELLEELKTSTLVEVLDDDRLPHYSRLKSLINTSFLRLSPKEREAFVSLAVFPGNFVAEEARAVMSLEKATERSCMKILRALEAKSLIESLDHFRSFTIHSLLRSFIDEKKFCDGATKTTFERSQLRFYGFYISSFEDANKKFFTGHSNDAVETFVSRRETILKSLVNGTRKDELYAKTMDVLSKTELFLFSVLHDEQLTFNRLYDTAVEEARRNKHCDIERKLLAAKSFGCLGYFFLNEQNPDSPLQHNFIDVVDCPPKLLCYGGIYQLLCGKLEEGILFLKRSVDRLNNDYGEKVFTILAYHVLAVCHRKQEDNVIASDFEIACSDECEAATDLSPTFCSLFLRDRKSHFSCPLRDSVAERVAFFFALTAELLPSLYKALGDEAEIELPLSVITSSLLVMQNVLLALFKESRVHFRILETCCVGLDRLNCYKEAAEGFYMITGQLEKEFGNHEDTARNYHYLGLAQKELKEYKAARCSFQKALKMRTKLLRETTETTRGIDMLRETLNSLSCYSLVLYESANSTSSDVDNIMAACEELDSIITLKNLDFPRVYLRELGAVCNNLGSYCLEKDDYDNALMLLQLSIRIKEKNLGDDVDTIASLNNLGLTYLKMKRCCESEKSYRRALELSMSLGINDREHTALSFHGISMVHFERGDYTEAEKAEFQCLRLCQEHLEDHPLKAVSFHQLGNINNKMSKYEAAINQFQEAVELKRLLFGNHPETALSYYELAKAQIALGDLSQAAATLQLLGCTCEALDNHEETAKGYEQIAELQRAMGDLSGALESIKNALRKRNQLSTNADTASTVEYLGLTYFEMGDYRSAREEFQKTASMRMELLGEHELTARSYHYLGLAQMSMKDCDAASISLRKALEMRTKLLGDHVDTAMTFHFLGNNYRLMGAHHLALEALQKAASIRTRLLGDHVDTATSCLFLAVVQREIGDLNGAFETVQKSLQLRQKLLGDHPDTATSIHFLGRVYFAMNDNRLALDKFQTALNMRSNLLGKHEETAFSFYRRGEVQKKMKDLDEAVESFQKSLQLRQELLGNHSDTAASLHSLGLAYFALGDTSSALRSLQKAADMRSQLLGCHEDTVCSYQWLAEAQESVGALNGAIESWKKAFEFAGV